MRELFRVSEVVLDWPTTLFCIFLGRWKAVLANFLKFWFTPR